MKMLQFVSPTAASLTALAVVVLLATTRPSFPFLRRYEPTIASLPLPSASSSSSSSKTAAAGAAAAVRRVPRECDIFRGEWVPAVAGEDDGAAPYYTNATCSEIQEHQNCIKYGRPDLGFLRWRWRPDGCDLPRFDAPAFLDLVAGKSLAFVGDSLARNHMQSLLCLLSQVERPREASPTADPEFRRVRYESHNFTIAMFRSPYLVTANQSNPVNGMWDVYLDEPDAAWASTVSGFDYVIVSTATWFNRRTMSYSGGRLVGCRDCHVTGVPDLPLHVSLRAALRTALRALTSAVGSRSGGGTVIVRTLSPTSHFEGGEWDKGGDCRRTRPRAASEAPMGGLDLDFHTVQVEEYTRAKEEARGGGEVRMMLMDTTAAMLMRPDGHPSRYGHWAHENVTLYNDCVHWCLPGPVDVWNEMLLQMLLRHRAGELDMKNLLSIRGLLAVARRHRHSATAKPTSVQALLVLLLLFAAATFSVFSLVPLRSPASSAACDAALARGEWVRDAAAAAAPYYTNATCSFIHDYQNCLKHGRPSTEFLRWRWRPAAVCGGAVAAGELRFDAARFLRLMRGKSMLFVGDSLASSHVTSLMCLLSQAESPSRSPRDADGFERWRFAAHGFEVSYFWTPFQVTWRLTRGPPEAVGPDRQGEVFAGPTDVHLDSPDVRWTSAASRHDVVVMAASHWFSRPAVYYRGGRAIGCHDCGADKVNVTVTVTVTPEEAQRAAFRTALRALVEGFNGTAILRTVAPTHYENGGWFDGGECTATRPAAGDGGGEVELAAREAEFYRAQVEEFAAAAARRGGARLRLMDVTRMMLLRPDGHPDRYGHGAGGEHDGFEIDCLHWCLPGAIDVWNELLLRMLQH
uniref:Trichome birefringence-like N-terminal domain-containing protein n=1 Tax=Leersia perrieri TaxID=77586 RepID=A0A0D9WP63_9ORYZ